MDVVEHDERTVDRVDGTVVHTRLDRVLAHGGGLVSVESSKAQLTALMAARSWSLMRGSAIFLEVVVRKNGGGAMELGEGG